MKNILVIIFLMVFNNTFAQLDETFTSHNLEQERIFKPGIIEKIGSVYLSDVDLFRPELVVFDSASKKLLVYDYAYRNLYAIQLENISGTEIIDVLELGDGAGSGPREFRNPTDLCLSGSGKERRVVIIDPDLGRVSIWGVEKDNFISSFRPEKFLPIRLACNEEKIILYNAGFQEEGEFAVYDYEGNLVSYLKEHNQRIETNISGMEGGFLDMNDSVVVFTRTDVELMKKYDHQSMQFVGKELFVNANLEQSEIVTTNNGDEIITKRSDEFIYRSRGVGFFKDYIVMLYSGREDSYSKTIDFYKIESLEYEFSVQTERYINRLVINNEVLTLRTYDEERKENYLEFYRLTTN
jgi:hypothetical protein